MLLMHYRVYYINSEAYIRMFSSNINVRLTCVDIVDIGHFHKQNVWTIRTCQVLAAWGMSTQANDQQSTLGITFWSS